MFCQKCGKELDDQAIICPACGVGTANYHQQQQAIYQPQQTQQTQQTQQNPVQSHQAIVITNTAKAVVNPRRYSVLFDIFMILISGGLWIIWMILRPKY